MKRTKFTAVVILLIFGFVIVKTTWGQERVDRRTIPKRQERGDSKAIQNKKVKGMIISAIQFTFEPADADKAESLLREIRDASIKEPGVVRFDVGRSSDDPSVFVLWEVYRDQSAIDAHKASEHFKRLVLDGIRPLARERTAIAAIPID